MKKMTANEWAVGVICAIALGGGQSKHALGESRIPHASRYIWWHHA